MNRGRGCFVGLVEEVVGEGEGDGEGEDEGVGGEEEED